MSQLGTVNPNDLGTIRCPKCKAPIKLTEAMAGPLLEQAQVKFDQDLARMRSDIESAALVKGAREYRELKEQLADRDRKLSEAQTAQASALRREQAAADKERELELTIARRVQVESSTIRLKASQDADESNRLKLAEKDETLANLSRQIEELKRRAEQGSQQLQGEAQEIELESMLRSSFPLDQIEPVGKGQFGGDILQRVVDSTGKVVGTVLWESKRTKNWSDGWLVKLREDQRAAKADVALLVTQTLPSVNGTWAVNCAFGIVDGVWVTEWKHALAVCVILRLGLVDLAGAKVANEGVETKAKLVYRYLTGAQFKAQVTSVIEKSAAMQESLEKERKAMTRLWAEREGLIRGVVEAMAGMYGSLQGIAGKGLGEVSGLQLPEGGK